MSNHTKTHTKTDAETVARETYNTDHASHLIKIHGLDGWYHDPDTGWCIDGDGTTYPYVSVPYGRREAGGDVEPDGWANYDGSTVTWS